MKGSPCNLSINAIFLNSDRMFIDILTMPTGQFCDYAWRRITWVGFDVDGDLITDRQATR